MITILKRNKLDTTDIRITHLTTIADKKFFILYTRNI